MLHSDKQGTPPCSDILFSSSPPSPLPAAPPVTPIGTATATTTTDSLRSIITTTATVRPRSEEHTSELQSLMRISYAVFCLKKKHQLYPQQQHGILTHRTTIEMCHTE